MNLSNLIQPNWFKKIDHHLMTTHVNIWETKIHYFIYFGLFFGIPLALIAYFFPFDFPNVPALQIFLFSGFVLLFMLFSFLMYYLRLQNRCKKKEFSVLNAYGLLLMYTINSLILFLLPIGILLLVILNAQNSIEYDEIDYFHATLELYNSNIEDAQYSAYSELTGHSVQELLMPGRPPYLEFERFQEPQYANRVREILRGKTGKYNAYIRGELQSTIEDIDLTQPHGRGTDIYTLLLQNQTFSEKLQEIARPKDWSKYLDSDETDRSSKLIASTADAYAEIESERGKQYNRDNSYQGKLTLIALGILLAFLSVNWLMLSRGHLGKGTSFIALIYLVLAAILVLAFGEYIFHTVVGDAGWTQLYTPALLFLSLIVYTYIRRNYRTNNFLLSLCLLSLIFLIPILYYNSISSELDILLRESPSWWELPNLDFLVILFIAMGLIIVHSLILYTYFNSRPKVA